MEKGNIIPELRKKHGLSQDELAEKVMEPRQLVCQCCGMPLDDSTISKDTNGDFNEEYCKWCYSDGEFKYSSKEELIDFCVEHMATKEWPAEQVRAHMEAVVPNLKHWK